VERGSFELSPSENVPTCCGLPSSVTTKFSAVRPRTGCPRLSRTSTSLWMSKVSTRTTSSLVELRSAFEFDFVSMAPFWLGSHLIFFRLEPKSLSFGLSLVCEKALDENSARIRKIDANESEDKRR